MADAEKSREDLLEEVERLRLRVQRLEQDREMSDALFRSLVNSVPDIIYRLDSQGRILFISDAVKRYGYDPEELIGASIFTLIHPEDRERATYRVNERRTGERSTRALEVRMLAREKDPVILEFKGEMGEGMEPMLEVSAEGVYNSEQPRAEGFVCTQGVARDITDRLQAERIRQETERVRVLTETAGAAAHEINQPLTVIVGMLEMMLAADEVEMKRDEQEEMLTAAQRINEIVQKMQTVHRYVTKPYVGDLDIADFDASSQE